MEESDDHERDLGDEEKANDSNKHHGGHLGISLVQNCANTKHLKHQYLNDSYINSLFSYLFLFLAICRLVPAVPMMMISEVLTMLVLLDLDPVVLSLFFLTSAFFMTA